MAARAAARWLWPFLAALSAACPGTMHEVDGRRVFNPFYSAFLDAGERDVWQKPDQVIAALQLPPGAVVADVGAGTGYFTERFSRVVGPTGRVYATDVQDEMLEALERRVAERGLANVVIVRAGFDDPALPAGCCDLVFLANVYKEIERRVEWAQRLLPALRPGGRVAIVEYRPDAPGIGPPEDVRLPETQVRAELAEAGFAVVERHDFLPRQSFVVFAPADAAAGPP
jgi:ubiquinone/menaquinone biosynthesis C-methylase UbiE